ncbi:DUF3810 domain-containing protein [Butyrivibrio sp. WCD2001]|uniref:DUF3810 domain-containing protein n=1 Tax=Butyrivibrio sp. WCD2001 TaxID=1280681 RepID=UPI00040B7829|nr:DUF3810 domain-containing protein [Butyrivibrio sp. WCD2001]
MKSNSSENKNTDNKTEKKSIAGGPIFVFLLIITILLNVFSWVIPGFSDIYSAKIFPIWVNTYGRFTSKFPFSVGEFMIIAGLIWLVMILFSKWIRRHTIRLLIIIALVMTLNCFVNYHTTPISDTYENSKLEDGTKREFTIAELTELRDEIVNICNQMSTEVPRNENGEFSYDEQEMKETAREAMSALGERFPKLSGYYVTPKQLVFSGFMSQQYMQGYFFPFSMEANYNDIMYITNKPFTMCHELAHTKSYIFEDEANFLAYLACINSDDIFFRYSGYLGVLNYVNNAFYANVSKEEYLSHVKISDQVKKDNVFLTEENWKKVEESSPLDTETVKKAADTFVDTTLKVNGVNDGKASYDRVVELMLLEYFIQTS